MNKADRREAHKNRVARRQLIESGAITDLVKEMGEAAVSYLESPKPKRGKLLSVDVTLPNWIETGKGRRRTLRMDGYRTNRVHINYAEAPALMKQYNLSEPMIHALAQSYGGYKTADERSYKALVARGFFDEPMTGFYYSTDLYDTVCAQLFVIEEIDAKAA